MAYSADPDKHRRAAGFLAGEPIPDADRKHLVERSDPAALTAAAAKPRPERGEPDELANIFRESLENW